MLERGLQVYDLRQVLYAWGQFHFAFHWITLALVLLRIVVPRPRKPNGNVALEGSAAATAGQS